MLTPDPIIEEIHAVRTAIANAPNDDVRRIALDARRRQRESGRQAVTLPSKPVDDAAIKTPN